MHDILALEFLDLHEQGVKNLKVFTFKNPITGACFTCCWVFFFIGTYIMNDAHYSNAIVEAFTSDVMFNATEVAKPFGKSPKEWLRLDKTEEYFAALAEVYGSENLVTVVKGGDAYTQGTWLHPKAGVAFARWLDARFAVWCDAQIDKLLRATGVSQQAVESLIEAAIDFERKQTALMAFEQRTKVDETKVQGLTEQQWADLNQVMFNISNESLDADKALHAIQMHFRERYKFFVDITFSEALSYLARVRKAYEEGYEPLCKGKSPVLDDQML